LPAVGAAGGESGDFAGGNPSLNFRWPEQGWRATRWLERRRGWSGEARVAGDVGAGGRRCGARAARREDFSLFRWRLEEDLCVVKKKFLRLFTK
jgi:hypothetical protein